MTFEEKRAKLKNFQNEKEFRIFLIDLLKKMNFKDVFHTHKYGSPELGKDIIAKYHHELEGDEWYSFVVKVGNISGGTNVIETIKNQIKQSFEYPYEGIKNERIKISKVKVITNENFTGGAQTTIRTSNELSLYNSNIDFWWYEKLIPHIDNFYNEFWLPGGAFIKEYSKSIISKIENEFELKELTLRKLEDKQIKRLLKIFIEPQLSETTVDEDEKKEKEFKRKSIQVKNIVQSEDSFILSGDFGCGKTKLLNSITCEIANTSNILTNNEIPIKLLLSEIKNNAFDIKKSISKQIEENIPDFSDRFDFKEFKLVVLLDNFEKFTKEEQEKVLISLNDFFSIYKGRYILTQRTSNNIELSSETNHVREVKINNFNINQISNFISKYFEETNKGQTFIEILKQSDILSKLPTTPLTITLLALLYDEKNYEIPATLTDIYDDFTQVLLGKLEIKNRNELLLFNIKKRIFTALSLKLLDEELTELSKDDFVNFVNDFLIKKGYESHEEDGIIQLIYHSGLLYYDEEREIVGFKQEAFLEYFASIEIYDHKRTSHYIKLLKNFNQINWQNTAIFFAGKSKDLPEMVDDLLSELPNNDLRDWFVNSGGMGFLSQALYMTDVSERKKLIKKSLDNLVLAFYKIKELTGSDKGIVKDMPLPFIAVILNYWFNENFKSITLKATLIESFNDLIEEYKNAMNLDFDGDFKLFMLASTLMNKNIDDDSFFSTLLGRDSFIKNPVLMLAGDSFLELGEIRSKNTNKDFKKKLEKVIKQHRNFLINFIKEPAYRFKEEYKMIDNEN